MALYRVGVLPEAPLDAAALFHARDLSTIRQFAEDVTLVFPPADHTHRGWRLAAVQSLARDCAPRRVNAVASDSQAAIAAAAQYLARAPGVTGQYWVLDETGVIGA